LFCIGFALITLCAINATAKPVTWYLQGVTWADGGTASGSFVYDVDNGFNGTYGSISITTVAGTVISANGFAFADPGATSTSLRFFPVTMSSGLTGTPVLILNFVSALTDAGGTVMLVTSGAFQSLWALCGDSVCNELDPEGPIVAVTAGAVTSTPTGDPSYYFVTYYSTANTSGAPDGTLRLVNDGGQATAETEGIPNGNLWASIYVFDDSQEMQDCCSCFVSPDGLLAESVNKQLANPALELTGRAELNRGVIKVLSSSTNDPTNVVVESGLRGWMTHVQATSTTVGSTKPYPSTGKSPFFVSESVLADSNLSAAELSALEESCSLAITLGSGFGACSCTPEDHDF